MAGKKKAGKNRRDAHGVYERREARGKAHYGETKYGGAAGTGKPSRNSRNNGYNREERPVYDYGGIGSRNTKRRAPEYSRSGDRRSTGRPQNWNDAKTRNASKFYEEEEPRADLLVGRNPVIEALRAGHDVERIYMAEGAGGSISIIRALAKEQGVSISMVDRFKLDHMAPGQKHQGVIAEIPAYHYSEMRDIFAKAAEADEQPFIVILDEITDPHNVGAIIRSAECMGAHGIIIPNRRACGLTSTVAKSAAGAIEQIPVVRVTNIGRTIEDLQAKGIWVAACDMDGEAYYKANLSGAVAIVIGNEGRGIGKLVKEKCDFTVSIPMRGKINSLNASNAAAIVMAEIRRRREL